MQIFLIKNFSHLIKFNFQHFFAHNPLHIIIIMMIIITNFYVLSLCVHHHHESIHCRLNCFRPFSLCFSFKFIIANGETLFIPTLMLTHIISKRTSLACNEKIKKSKNSFFFLVYHCE